MKSVGEYKFVTVHENIVEMIKITFNIFVFPLISYKKICINIQSCTIQSVIISKQRIIVTYIVWLQILNVMV